MNMKLSNFILLLLLIMVSIGCGSGSGSDNNISGTVEDEGSVRIRYVGTRPMGYYEVVMEYGDDTDYDIGVLYGEALTSQFPTLEAGYAATFSSMTDYPLLMARIQQIKNQIPDEYRDLIEGLSSRFNGGSNNNKDDDVLSVDEVFYFSLITTVNRTTQCSVIAVYDSYSHTSKPIIGRLMDWSAQSLATVFYIRNGSKKIMNIGGTLLDLSTLTGLNQYGIFVAVLDAGTGAAFPDLSSEPYHAYTFDLRYALENFSTISDIADHLTQNKYTFNHIIVIGDNNTVKVLENDLTGARALRDSASVLQDGVTWDHSNSVAAVNAFLLKNNYDNFTGNPFNTYRWQTIDDELDFYTTSGIPIAVEDMKSITTFYGTDIYSLDDGVIMNPLTQQIFIYDAHKSSLQGFFKNNRTIAHANTTTSFDVDDPDFWDIPVEF